VTLNLTPATSKAVSMPIPTPESPVGRAAGLPPSCTPSCARRYAACTLYSLSRASYSCGSRSSEALKGRLSGSSRTATTLAVYSALSCQGPPKQVIVNMFDTYAPVNSTSVVCRYPFRGRCGRQRDKNTAAPNDPRCEARRGQVIHHEDL
jgi:hypothetical protein